MAAVYSTDGGALSECDFRTEGLSSHARDFVSCTLRELLIFNKRSNDPDLACKLAILDTFSLMKCDFIF